MFAGPADKARAIFVCVVSALTAAAVRTRPNSPSITPITSPPMPRKVSALLLVWIDIHPPFSARNPATTLAGLFDAALRWPAPCSFQRSANIRSNCDSKPPNRCAGTDINNKRRYLEKFSRNLSYVAEHSCGRAQYWGHYSLTRHFVRLFVTRLG